MTKLSKRQAIKLVLIAARVHPFPYRTRKLSSLALKILGGKLPGKISRCQHTKPYIMYGFFVFTLTLTTPRRQCPTGCDFKMKLF